ncbi:MAG: hypothetical protein ACI8RD_000303, partial [Bacillariaceae sp.]
HTHTPHSFFGIRFYFRLTYDDSVRVRSIDAKTQKNSRKK